MRWSRPLMKKRIETMSRTTPVRKFLQQRGAAHCQEAQVSIAINACMCLECMALYTHLHVESCLALHMPAGWLRGGIVEGLHTSNGTLDASLKGRRA